MEASGQHQLLYDWVEKPVVPTEQEWSGTVRKPKIVCLCQDWTLDHPPPSPIIMGCDLPTVHVKTACNQLSIQLKSLYDHPTNMMLKELLQSLVVGMWTAEFHIKISDFFTTQCIYVFNAIFPHTEFKYWHFYRKQTVLSVRMNWIFTHNVH